MGHLDLDAARAARDEARADVESPTVTVGGKTYELTPVLLIDAADAYRRSDGAAFVRGILVNPDEADEFLANRLAWADLDEILTVWRVDPGESSASAASSTNGGTRSRRTSQPSTD